MTQRAELELAPGKMLDAPLPTDSYYPRSATVFDIETRVDWDVVLSDDFAELGPRSYSPPGGYKKSFAIACHHTDWWFKKRKAWALDPLTARVCSIAWCDLWEGGVDVIASDDEEVILQSFATAMHEEQVLTGFNVRHFDIPFVTARASILGIDLPWWWPHSRDYRRIADIRDVAGDGKCDHWLRRCGLEPKIGSGDMVEIMPLSWIETYNHADAYSERELAQLFAPNMPALRATQTVNYDEVPSL